MHWNDLVRAAPDILLVMPCGFGIERTLSEMDALTGKAEWSLLRAVQNRHVYVTDGHQFFNRSGPRLLESLEILAEIIHPEVFMHGHQGNGWIVFDAEISR